LLVEPVGMADGTGGGARPGGGVRRMGASTWGAGGRIWSNAGGSGALGEGRGNTRSGDDGHRAEAVASAGGGDDGRCYRILARRGGRWCGAARCSGVDGPGGRQDKDAVAKGMGIAGVSRKLS